MIQTEQWTQSKLFSQKRTREPVCTILKRLSSIPKHNLNTVDCLENTTYMYTTTQKPTLQLLTFSINFLLLKSNKYLVFTKKVLLVFLVMSIIKK